MSTTAYGAPRHAWYFIALIHRLAANPHGYIVFAPRSKTLNTIRTKLHHSRQYITSTTKADFVPYQHLCMATRLDMHAEHNQLHLTKLDMFDSFYDSILAAPNEYDEIVRGALSFVSAHNQLAFQRAGLSLDEPQKFGLTQFFQMFPVIRQAIVENNIIVLRK